MAPTPPPCPAPSPLLSQRIDRGTTSVQPRGTVGITKAQADQIITDLRADERTRRTDLPDLLQFIAGTGCRTSEATALTWDQLDLDALPATVLINALRPHASPLRGPAYGQSGPPGVRPVRR